MKLFRIILSFILVLLTFCFDFSNTWNIIIYILAYLIVGFDVIIKAIKNIIQGHILDENFLMSIATIGAFYIGTYLEAVAVMLFYQIGELFQSYAVDKSRKSISDLMDIRSDYANVYRDNVVKKVNPEDVEINEIILVKPGEKIPLDGIVVDGSSSLNMFALIGESIPRVVRVNDEVLSGCINNDGVLKISVSKKFGESTVSKILNLVENVSSRKAKSENFITKFAKYYTPIVVVIAVFLALIPPLFMGYDFSDWLYRALSFLVVSCPCALVVSVPLSFFGGIGAASRVGVLIKGSNYLEALSSVKNIVCDKTGTLTKGVFQVQKINSFDYKKSDLLKYATYAESYSNHPISLSLREAYNKKIDNNLVTDVKEIVGMGVIANVDKKQVIVGNDKIMNKYKIKYQKSSDVGTIIYVAVNKKFVGSIVISDEIRDTSYLAVDLFRKNGVENIIMLTGDLDSIANYVSKKLKLDKYYAQLLPQDKVKIVEELIKKQKKDEKLAFIGDGINDAPVLALSDIGVSMGGVGSDAAIEASDVVIMNDDISKLASAIGISKKTMKIVYQNIVFAILVKLIVLVLSAIGVASLWSAVFADVGVLILVVLNSLRVLIEKK